MSCKSCGSNRVKTQSTSGAAIASAPRTSNHILCISHGHCMFPIRHPNHVSCPMHSTNYSLILKTKTEEMKALEKETILETIKLYEVLKLNGNANYYDMLITKLKTLLKYY